LPTGSRADLTRQPTWSTTYQGNDGAPRDGRDGFLTMGDVGYLDRDGYCSSSIARRHGDLRRCQHLPGRDRASAIDVPGVEDCAVFGIPDDEFGEALRQCNRAWAH
jgi:long-chain acyl-CoA synthetase